MLIIFLASSICLSTSSRTLNGRPQITETKSTEIFKHQIYLRENVEIVNSVFSKCTSLGTLFDEAGGGAIWAINSNFNIIHCQFSSNSALYGGCICAYGCIVMIEKSKFMDSFAIYDVGGIWAMGDGTDTSSLTIDNCSFINNYAERYYGSVAANKTFSKITNCIFRGNSAKEAVGALGIIGRAGQANASLCTVSFVNNTSNGSYSGLKCPALYLQNDDKEPFCIYLSKCYFNSNFGEDNKNHALATIGKISLNLDGYLCFDGETNNWCEFTDKPGINNPDLMFGGIDSFNECKMLFPTVPFTQSNLFTPSEEFIPSNPFTTSKEFTQSQTINPQSTFLTNGQSLSSNEEISTIEVFPQSISTYIDKPTQTVSNTVDQTMANSQIQSFIEDFPTDDQSISNESNHYEQSNTTNETPNQSQSSISEKSSVVDEKEEEELPFNIPSLAGGIGLLLIIIIIIIIVICICKKKKPSLCNFCCCGKKKENGITNNQTDVYVRNERKILMLPRVPEHDDEFADYINPEYARKMFGLECERDDV